MTNDLFEGELEIEIAEQHLTTKAQRVMVRDAFGDGDDVPGVVRFSCRIAMDVNAAIAEGIVFEDGKTYVPNPKARAQFGKNTYGKPYLTFGLIEPKTGTRLTLTWAGPDVPIKMIQAAIAHDEGKNVAVTVVPLDFGRARVHPTGNSDGKGNARDRRQNHDTGPDGMPYPRPERRKHSRVCRSDLEVLRALQQSIKNAGRG